MPVQKKKTQSKDTLLSIATGFSLMFVIVLLGWLVVTVQNVKRDRLLTENIEMEPMDSQLFRISPFIK